MLVGPSNLQLNKKKKEFHLVNIWLAFQLSNIDLNTFQTLIKYS